MENYEIEIIKENEEFNIIYKGETVGEFHRDHNHPWIGKNVLTGEECRDKYRIDAIERLRLDYHSLASEVKFKEGDLLVFYPKLDCLGKQVVFFLCLNVETSQFRCIDNNFLVTLDQDILDKGEYFVIDADVVPHNFGQPTS
jgi:hypothetical protein